MLPPAPMRFSTITCCCQSSDHLSATRRAVKSAAPPGVKVTMMRTGFAGYVPCAMPALAARKKSSAKASRMAAAQCYPYAQRGGTRLANRFDGVHHGAPLRVARQRRQFSEQAGEGDRHLHG